MKKYLINSPYHYDYKNYFYKSEFFLLFKGLNTNMTYFQTFSDFFQTTQNDNNKIEILNKLEEVELNEQFKNEEELKCSICLENFSTNDKISYLPCAHFFHSSCIKNWIRIKNKCLIYNNIIKL